MRNILFAVLIASFLMVGTANAGNGAWINFGDATWSAVGSGSTKWMTFVHVMNPTANTVTATVTFYGSSFDGTTQTSSVLVSTTRTLAPNALWDFSNMDASLSDLAATPGVVTKGGVLIEPSGVVGATSMFYNNTASGFNFNW